ncbi:MAG: gamma carbonic anhydrase family protein [Alphaproteobacteria bacterium]
MLYALDGQAPEIDKGAGFVAPDAALIGRVRLAAGASVWFGSVLRGDNEWIAIGENSNVQDGSVLHTDMGTPLEIGKNVTIGHKVMLHGCRIADKALIGIGSIVLNHATIGSYSILGANSFVAEGKEIPDGVLALGSPARVLRDLTPEEIEMIDAAAAHYVQNSQRFAASLKKIHQET